MHDTLSNIKVLAKKYSASVSSPTPVQILNTVNPSKTNSLSVADAVKYFAGVSVKDFGGIGGLKTVSVRSLGANHTGLLYDGIALGNAQAGQVDLGKFSLDNIYQIELNNSVPSDILSTAKSYSYASLLSLKTSTGFNKKDSVNTANFKIQTGSFGYISPSFAFYNQINKRLSVSGSAQYQKAVSAYPYVSYENSSSRPKRINSDIKTNRTEIDAVYEANDRNKIVLKTFFYNSERGLPGAIIFYNTISNQRLNEREMFVQGSWKNIISKKSELLLSAKYEKDKSYYIDPAYLNSVGKLENEFYQKEMYVSGVYGYNFNDAFKMSFASDAFKNSLTRTDIFSENFATPTRNSWLNNVAFQLKKRHYEFSGNVLYSIINEKVVNGESANNFRKFSNGLALSFQPFMSIPFRTRFFYKHIFRAPTFNDLYYTNVGNTKLRPEFVDQYNFGFTYEKQPIGILKQWSITSDAYYNFVNDKILTAPRQNLFQWSVQNIGKVKIRGIDVALNANFKEWKNLQISTNATFTVQDAKDVSDQTSTLYKTQLPYTPKHSGSGSLHLQYRQFSGNYNILFSSFRYKWGDPIYENLLQPFATNDVSISYLFKAKNAAYKLIFEANNIFNTQYEIVKYYPMPLSNYRLTFNIFLNQKKPINEFTKNQ